MQLLGELCAMKTIPEIRAMLARRLDGKTDGADLVAAFNAALDRIELLEHRADASHRRLDILLPREPNRG